MNTKNIKTIKKPTIGFPKLVMPLALATAAIVGSNTPAKALNFYFTYAPGSTLEQMLGYEMAGAIWSSYLTESTDVYIHFETTDQLPTTAIGGALPGIKPSWYADVRNQLMLGSNQTSNDDLLVKNYLNNKPWEIDARVNGTVIQNNLRMNLTRANAKALGGLNVGIVNSLDGAILMNKNANWDYNYLRNTSIASDKIDFLSVAMHEVGHILGFISGIDKTNVAVSSNTSETAAEVTIKSNVSGGYREDININPLDLFRFSATSKSQNTIELTPGVTTYFSLDGGNTSLTNFSTGENGGDGYQASHWKAQSTPLGIMNPTLVRGQRRNISDLDLRALDAIGWERNFSASAPNLATLRDRKLSLLKDKLSSKGLSVSTDWLKNNLKDANASLLLTQDRNAEVNQMIDNSMIYQARSSTGGSSGSWYQREQVYNMLASSEEVQSEEVQSVPEPASTTGLLGLGLLAIASVFKRRGKK